MSSKLKELKLDDDALIKFNKQKIAQAKKIDPDFQKNFEDWMNWIEKNLPNHPTPNSLTQTLAAFKIPVPKNKK